MSRLLPELLKKKQHHENLVEITRKEIARLIADVDRLEAGIDDEYVMINEINRAIAALEPDLIHEPETQTGDEGLGHSLIGMGYGEDEPDLIEYE